MRAAGTPTCRDASLLPPTAKVQLPKRVLPSTNTATAVKPTNQRVRTENFAGMAPASISDGRVNSSLTTNAMTTAAPAPIMSRAPSTSASWSTELRSSKSVPTTTHAAASKAMPSMTPNASDRNFTDSDSERTKNAMTTISTVRIVRTTLRVITLTRRAWYMAIASDEMPTVTKISASVPRRP